ncbi:MAG: Signal peptidase-like protein [Bacteroidetes bacterium]|nr:MAG: Signal peptidase-like protein [Bacteroidota bacterium]
MNYVLNDKQNLFKYIFNTKYPELLPAGKSGCPYQLLTGHEVTLLSKHYEPILNEKFRCGFHVANFKYCNHPEPDYSNFCEVTFKSKRKLLYKNSQMFSFSTGTFVVVEVDNGCDIGTVTACGQNASEKLKAQYKNVEPLYQILRLATLEDLEKFVRNTKDETAAINKTKHLVAKHQLEMKITEAEWQFDRQRLTIYFGAPQRIDFRELVKDLARTFKTRIELRQISTREEAKRLGGVGACGRDLCCESFACEFCHVTLDHARIQQLSNNVAKLSGYCGRLKCCLLYEYDSYSESMKKFPPINSLVELDAGKGKIVKIDVFRDVVYVQLEKNNTYSIITLIELGELYRMGKIKVPANTDIKSLFCEDSAVTIEELQALEGEF